MTAPTMTVCVGLCGGNGFHGDAQCMQDGADIPDSRGRPVNVAAYAAPAWGKVGVCLAGRNFRLDHARQIVDALMDAIAAAENALEIVEALDWSEATR